MSPEERHLLYADLPRQRAVRMLDAVEVILLALAKPDNEGRVESLKSLIRTAYADDPKELASQLEAVGRRSL